MHIYFVVVVPFASNPSHECVLRVLGRTVAFARLRGRTALPDAEPSFRQLSTPDMVRRLVALALPDAKIVRCYCVLAGASLGPEWSFTSIPAEFPPSTWDGKF